MFRGYALVPNPQEQQVFLANLNHWWGETTLNLGPIFLTIGATLMASYNEWFAVLYGRKRRRTTMRNGRFTVENIGRYIAVHDSADNSLRLSWCGNQLFMLETVSLFFMAK